MRHLTLIAIALLAAGCGNDTTTPSLPANSTVVLGASSPPSGGVVVVPESYPYIIPGGVALPAHSGLISVGLSMTLAHEVPRAQLSVYLLTGEGGSDYCGQNTPDSPTWGQLPAGWTTTYAVTGFRVYRLPCEVTGIRAMLHTRNDGRLTPPTPDETIAETTVAVRYQIRR